MPKGLFPQQDTGNLKAVSDGPQDISFTAMMKERQEAANEVLRRHPAIAHATSFIGGSTMNTGNAFIELKSVGERKQTADEVITELRLQLGKIPGNQVFLQSVQDVRMGGRMSRAQYQYSMHDASLDELAEWAPRMVETLRALRGTHRLSSSLRVRDATTLAALTSALTVPQPFFQAPAIQVQIEYPAEL